MRKHPGDARRTGGETALMQLEAEGAQQELRERQGAGAPAEPAERTQARRRLGWDFQLPELWGSRGPLLPARSAVFSTASLGNARGGSGETSQRGSSRADAAVSTRKETLPSAGRAKAPTLE